MGQGGAFEVTNPYAGTGFPLYVWRVERGREDARRAVSGELHWHDDLQFSLVEEGEIRFDAPGCHVVCKPHEIVFVNAGVPHRIVNDASGSYVSCAFPQSMLGFFPGSLMQVGLVAPLVSPGATSALHMDGSVAWHRELMACMKDLAGMLVGVDEPREPQLAYEASALLVKMWAALAPHLRFASHGAAAQRRALRLRAGMLFIDAHFAEPLSLADIAQSAHVSPSECGRCFKDSLGITPYRYLMDVRLEHARALLAAGDQSVTEIALACGFGSASHLDNAFRASTGLSPSEFRRGQ